ncbi:MAG: lysylphosphatidylglycerol synthase transmembrane domain-containing protein [Steroidobacteraceae bacterium]
MKQILKAIVGVTLITVLVINVDWRAMLTELQQADPYLLAAAFIGCGMQFFLTGWKWGWAIRLFDTALPFRLTVRLYAVAHFVGQFLPTAIGGDAYRIYRVRRLLPSSTVAISSLVVERFMGLVILLLLAAIACLLLAPQYLVARSYLLLMGFGMLGGLVVLVALHYGMLKQFTGRLERFGWFIALRNDYGSMMSARAAWVAFLGLSVAFQVMSIFIVFLVFRAIGSDAGFAQAAFITMVGATAGILPISINGLGVSEGSMVGAALALGLQPEHALLMAIFLRALVMPFTLLCGLLYLAEPKPDQIQPAAQ